MLSHAGITHDIQGKTYCFEPLTLETIEYMELWLRGRAIEAGRMSLPDDISEEEKDRRMRPIIEHAQSISVFAGDGFDKIMTPSGVARLLYRLLYRNHPEITVAQCMEWLRDKEVMGNLKPKLALITKPNRNGDSNNQNGAAGGQPSRPFRRKQKQK